MFLVTQQTGDVPPSRERVPLGAAANASSPLFWEALSFRRILEMRMWGWGVLENSPVLRFSRCALQCLRPRLIRVTEWLPHSRRRGLCSTNSPESSWPGRGLDAVQMGKLKFTPAPGVASGHTAPGWRVDFRPSARSTVD